MTSSVAHDTSTTRAHVAHARDGDRRAWDRIVAGHTPMLWAIARGHRLHTADCADAVQCTWLRCVQHLEDLRDPDRLAGWLAAICRRECRGIQKRQRRQRPDDPTDDTGPLARLATDDAVDELERTAVRTAVRAAIGDLPDHQRRVVLALLRAEQSGDGYADVAAALAVPIGTLGPTRQRALARLRRDPRIAALAA